MDGRLGLDWLAPRSALEGWVMVGPCFAGERRNYCRLCSVVATVPENRTADCVLRPALAESAAVLIVIGSSTSSVHDNGGSKELVGRLFFFHVNSIERMFDPLQKRTTGTSRTVEQLPTDSLAAGYDHHPFRLTVRSVVHR
jgi:hypothetical protein